MAILIIIMIPVGLFMGDIPNETLKFQIYDIHKAFGLLLLALILIRIIWKFINIQPSSLTTKRWQQIIEHGVQHAFYTVLLIMPLSGWAMSTASNHAPTVFGHTFYMPGIIINKKVAGLTHAIHEYVGYLLIALLVLHIAAAMKHHFIDKDGIFQKIT
jgi:cytochrome b561